MEKHNNLSEIQGLSNCEILLKNFNSEIKNLSPSDLQNTTKKLNYLCYNLNPYDALDLSIEEENILQEFDLKSYLTNPFDFTNIVLQLLDTVENEIKSRSH